MQQETYTIADLAEEFDITPRTLRFYEDKGLLNPQRQGMNRVYGRRDRARLLLILRGRRLGFKLDDISEMLDLYDSQGGNTKQLRVTLEKSREQLARLEEQRRDINEAITELNQNVAEMETLLAVREKQVAEG